MRPFRWFVRFPFDHIEIPFLFLSSTTSIVSICRRARVCFAPKQFLRYSVLSSRTEPGKHSPAVNPAVKPPDVFFVQWMFGTANPYVSPRCLPRPPRPTPSPHSPASAAYLCHATPSNRVRRRRLPRRRRLDSRNKIVTRTVADAHEGTEMFRSISLVKL